MAPLNPALALLAALAAALLVTLGVLLSRRRRERERLAALARQLEALAAPAAESRADGSGEAMNRLSRALERLREALDGERRAWERQRAERDLLLAHVSDAVALLDGDDRILDANRAFADLFGRGILPAAGSPLSEALRSPEVLDLVREARSSAVPVDRELRLRGADTRVVEARGTRVATAGPGTVLLVLRDLTERERQVRIRQDFVANVSHELRTPLTSIRGYAETLLDGGLEDETNRGRFVGVIREQAARLESLVEDLLSLAELERPGLELKLSRFDLRLLAQAQVAAFRERAQSRGLALTLEPGLPVEVLADRGRLEQVLANLLDNAIKYTEHGGVRLSVGGDERRVWCEVADTGVGIAPGEQSRIFERFYRVDKARSSEMGGTGLGLAIVKHILAQHRGEISVESTLGKGTRFRIELPR